MFFGGFTPFPSAKKKSPFSSIGFSLSARFLDRFFRFFLIFFVGFFFFLRQKFQFEVSSTQKGAAKILERDTFQFQKKAKKTRAALWFHSIFVFFPFFSVFFLDSARREVQNGRRRPRLFFCYFVFNFWFFASHFL